MKTQIDKMLKKYKTLKEVARVLGITERQLYNVQNGEKCGKHLAFTIKTHANLIDLED